MKTIALAIAWIVIAVPLGWGVYQSVQKSMPLFEGQAEPAALSRHVEDTRGGLCELLEANDGQEAAREVFLQLCEVIL